MVYTLVVSTDVRHVFVGASLISHAASSQSIDKSHGPPTKPGGIVKFQEVQVPLWKLADLMCSTHTPCCCRNDAATSKENLQRYFLARDDECDLVSFLSP